MTTANLDTHGEVPPRPGPVIVGRLRIDWPPATGGTPDTVPVVLGWRLGLFDVDTGQDIGLRTLHTVITVDPKDAVLADLTMLVDHDGHATDTPTYGATGEVLTGVFRWMVAEVSTQ